MAHDNTVLEFGGFRLNRGERSLLTAAGAPIQLTRRLYDMLLYMAERPGRLLEKQALMDAVWKGAVVEENTLSRTVSNLRQLLGERVGERRCIETVSGLGYRFVASVMVPAGGAVEPAAHRRLPSIAVLPFADLSRDRDQGYFGDGIAEEVLNRLATVPGLRVIAKGSAFRFRDDRDSARAIGAALGVDYLLSGAVRKDARELRITAQLVDMATETQRWSERFDRTAEMENVFAIQDDIARAVTYALRGVLGAGEPSPTQGGTCDPEAYDLFLRGRALIEQSGAHAALRSAELFRSAVARDPRFASRLAVVRAREPSTARVRTAARGASRGRSTRSLRESSRDCAALVGRTHGAGLAAPSVARLARDGAVARGSPPACAGDDARRRVQLRHATYAA